MSTFRELKRMQIKAGTEFINGVRIEPTEQMVRDVLSSIKRVLEEDVTVETLYGKTGEAGYWPPKNIIEYMLKSDDLRGCCEFEPVPNAIFVHTGAEVEQVLADLGFGLDDVDVERTVRFDKDGLSHIAIFFDDSNNVKKAHAAAGKKGWESQDVMDMTVRGLIDGGARAGSRRAGGTGQTIDGLSFKAMVGMTNALVPNFFPMLAFNGDDSHENYNSVAPKSLAQKKELEKYGIFHNGVYYAVTFEHGGDGKLRRGLQGKISALGKQPNDTCDCD